MRKIVITGGDGFRAFHMRAFLLPFEKKGEIEVVSLTRDIMDDATHFAEALLGADVVIPLAGVNRGEEDVVYQTNIALAHSLVTACEHANVKPHIVFASTIHHDRDTAYGRSKRDSAAIFEEWGERNVAPVSTIIFPNIFGEYGKPYYNSVVATFCHELAHQKDSIVDGDASIELLHAHSAAAHMYETVVSVRTGEFRVEGTTLKVSEVYEKLKSMATLYRSGRVPYTETVLDTELFMVLHSHLFSTMFPYQLDKKTDERGSLFQVVKSEGESEVFFSTTRPGQVRGNHYHFRKMERFCVVRGVGEILIRRLFSNEVSRYSVSGDTPVVVDMPTYTTHALRNTGDVDMVALFWANEQFNPADPDTFPESTELSAMK